jgi:pseudaminic acid cytidylyltransferase
MNIVIIPARIGSKRIKKKNIKFFLGIPIIKLLIQKLIKTKLFNKIYISTDSKEITNVCYSIKNKNLLSIIKRPKNLSTDHIGTREVIINSIKRLDIKKNDNLFCIYPTSIFFKKKNIQDAIKSLKMNKNSYIFSAKKIDQNFFRGFYYKKKKMNLIFKKNYNKRTQDIEQAYVDAAQFYVARKKTWLNCKKIFNLKSKIIELDKNQTCDIDQPDDWIFSEYLYKYMILKKKVNK